MLYADFTIIFVNTYKIVAHFHIYYREKVYIFLQKNRICHKLGHILLVSFGKLVAGFALFNLANTRLGVNALPLVIIGNCALESLFRKNGAVDF